MGFMSANGIWREIRVNEDNINAIKDDIDALDQRGEIGIGQIVSTWPIRCANGDRGQITLWHETQRAAICFGGDSLWGDWNPSTSTISTDPDGEVYDADGKLVSDDDHE
jgi:hypothetical protein